MDEHGERGKGGGTEEKVCEHHERLHGMTFSCECNVKNLCPFHCCREHGRFGTVPGQSGEVVEASSGPTHNGSIQKAWRRRQVVRDTIIMRLFAESEQAASYLAQERGANRLRLRLCYSYCKTTRESFDMDPVYKETPEHWGDVLGSDYHSHFTTAFFCLHCFLLICLWSLCYCPSTVNERSLVVLTRDRELGRTSGGVRLKLLWSCGHDPSLWRVLHTTCPLVTKKTPAVKENNEPDTALTDPLLGLPSGAYDVFSSSQCTLLQPFLCLAYCPSCDCLLVL